jgi:hypothetical protein
MGPDVLEAARLVCTKVGQTSDGKQPSPEVRLYSSSIFLCSTRFENAVNRIPKFLIAVVAIAAAISVLFVLITPAPDELPSTGPHSLVKLFVSLSDPIYLKDSSLSATRIETEFLFVFAGIDVLSLTCSRL